MTELVPPAGYQNYRIIIVPSMPGALLAEYTPGYMELVGDEDTKELVVGDGQTQGGLYRLAGVSGGGGNTWGSIHIDGAGSATDLVPTAGSTLLTVGGLYGFVFSTDVSGKKLIGALPIPGPVGEGLLSTGSSWVSGIPTATFNGRELPTAGELGDYTTQLVEEVLGRNYLNAPVITPPTDGQALIYSSSAVGYVGGTAGGGGGTGPTPINLLSDYIADITNPPSILFYNGVRVLSFANATSQIIYGSLRWPAGSSFAIKLHCSMLTATSGTLGFGFQMMKITPGGAFSIKTDDFATENLGSASVPGTINRPFDVSIAVTNLDGAAEGDYVRWKLRRNTSVGGNAAGNGEVWTAMLIPTA